jgi:hypothetical protein
VTPPRPRNPLLADAFKRAGIVERTARGIDTIYSEQLRNGRPPPSYERSTEAAVSLVLHRGEASLEFVRLVAEESRDRILGLDELLILNQLWQERRLSTGEVAGLIPCGKPTHTCDSGKRRLAARIEEARSVSPDTMTRVSQARRCRSSTAVPPRATSVSLSSQPSISLSQRGMLPNEKFRTFLMSTLVIPGARISGRGGGAEFPELTPAASGGRELRRTGPKDLPCGNPQPSPIPGTGAGPNHDLHIQSESREVPDETLLRKPVEASVDEPGDRTLIDAEDLPGLVLGQPAILEHRIDQIGEPRFGQSLLGLRKSEIGKHVPGTLQ